MARRIAFLALFAAPLMAMASVPAAAQGQAPWRDVTPRAGLAGWHTAGGKAVFDVANGELIGRAAPGSANSWLVSDAHYGDFILEFDAKTDQILNSGVMIRGRTSALASPIREGHISTTLCHLGNIAYRTGSMLSVDESTGKPSSPDAMKLWSVDYEPGWEVKA